MEDDPKTESSVRTLPMDSERVEVLRRARRRQAADKLQLGEAYQHADASVTARIYTHSQDEALRAAAKTLGEVVTTRDTQAG